MFVLHFCFHGARPCAIIADVCAVCVFFWGKGELS